MSAVDVQLAGPAKLRRQAADAFQWMTCWKHGWNEPTALARIGQDFGHDVLPVLIILAVIVLVVPRSLIRL